jgi:hypothetical protein
MVNVGKREDSMLDLILDNQKRTDTAIRYIENMALTDPTLMLIALDITRILRPAPPRT